jgi:cardiolipin synthase A/B
LHRAGRAIWEPTRHAGAALRHLADQAFSRAAGAPLVPGNSVRLLCDARENYPAWLDAIHSARRTIHFESYIIHEDDEGRRFAEALAARARAGVQVRLIYDWLGALGKTSRRFWRTLAAAGAEVRCFNPPRLDSPLGWLSRDHRKMISVDGQVAFVTGLCVGRMWVGDPSRGIAPWRDTGVEVRGPAVADIERAFADVWSVTGPPMPPLGVPSGHPHPPVGDVALRVVASVPNTAGLYRLDLLVAAVARKSLWLTDAYYAGVTPYVQALRAAAADGVDVRLLVPGPTDIPILRPISQAGYRPLLEAGVRVFEWNGPMLHAKTAVADGRWARVGSSNLNLASWLSNWELDVVVEDESFAQAMEATYRHDLANATEIVLEGGRILPPRRARRSRQPGGAASSQGGSMSRAAAGALRLGNSVGAALTNHRVLGPAEAHIAGAGAVLLLVLAVTAAWWPRLVAVPISVAAGWVAIELFVRALRLRRGRQHRDTPSSGPPTADPSGRS